MERLARAFEKRYSGITVRVLPSIGSTGGIKAVRDGTIDLAVSSRPLKPDEVEPGLVEEPYGRTPFTFSTPVATATAGLTLNQLERIYRGETTTWPDGTPLRLIIRPRTDASSHYLAGISPGLAEGEARSHQIPGVHLVVTDQEAAAQIEKTAGSLGVTTMAVVKAEARRVKGLDLDGVAPTLANMATGKYPHAMTVSLVYRKERLPGANGKFLTFVFSPEGQKILRDCGHLPIKRHQRR
jgi:phosphate transport system substrate-binding protein